MLAAKNPLSLTDRPHQLFADAPPPPQQPPGPGPNSAMAPPPPPPMGGMPAGGQPPGNIISVILLVKRIRALKIQIYLSVMNILCTTKKQS